MSSWISVLKRKNTNNRNFVIRVPKRIIPLSTDRSRIKRLIREAVRIGEFKPPQGMQWIFSIRKKAPKGIKMQEVLKHFKSAL